MARKVLVLFILCFLIVGLAAWAAKEKPKSETAIAGDRVQKIMDRLQNEPRPVEANIVTKYITSPMPELSLPATKDTAGYSYYDYQHNQMMRRQIANDYGNKRHFTWMYSPTAGDVVAGLRDVHYNSKVEVGAPTFGWLVLYGQLASATTGRGGYCGLDILNDSREVLIYHNVGALTNTTVNVEKTTPGLGEFRIFDVPDSIPGGLSGGIWPSVAVQKNSTAPVYIHVGIQENQPSGEGIGGYTRCYQFQDSLLKCQGPGTPEYTLSSDVAYPLSNYSSRVQAQMYNTNVFPVTSPVSRKVAFVWQWGTSRENNDIFYAVSDSGGDDWIHQGTNAQFPLADTHRVTNYEAGGYTRKLFGEYAGVFDYNDNLHIVWATYEGSSDRTVTLWHYTDGLPANQRVKQVTSHTAANWVDQGGFNLILTKMTLGVNYLAGPRHNWLYCLWSQFDGPPADTSAAGYANSELYVAASSNSGLSWSQPYDITNTHTNGCTAGNCRSEHWASLAERVDSILHIQYVMDLDAGGFVMTEGSGTKDPIRYLRYPESSINIPAVPTKIVTPMVFAYPTIRVNNGGSVSDTLEVANSGTATLYVKTDVPTASYVTLSPANYNIIEGGDAVKEVITFDATSLSDTILYDSIRVASNHGLLGGAESYIDTEWVYFTLLVSSDPFYTDEFDTIDTHTGGIKMVLSNAGRLGHGDQGSGVNGTYNGKDYMFDGSVALATSYPGYNLGATQLYKHEDFLPEGNLQVAQQPEFATWGITTATATYAPMVHRIGTPYQWFWWWWTIEDKDVFFENERIMVKYAKLYRNPPPTWWRAISEPVPLPTVYFGYAADIDAAGPSSCSNGSFANIGVYDQAKNLIYMKGDTVCNTNEYAGMYFYFAARDEGTTHDTAFAPYAAAVLNSTNSIHMNSNDGYPDDTLYKYMTTPGWSVPGTPVHYEANIVISARRVDNGSGKIAAPSAPTLVTAKYAFVMSDAGLAGLYKPMCGNANRDDKISVSDVVFLVNYLFKGGPKPFMYYANANGDNKISVSDVVYLINYLFKGGAKPVCNYPIALP